MNNPFFGQLLLVIAVCLILLACDLRAETFYVSPDGNNKWSGKLKEFNAARTDGPLASLTGARDAIRRLKGQSGLKQPVEVVVRAGAYSITEPFTLEPRDSGTEQCPITYAAETAQQPIITGGRVISNWKKDDGEVWTANIPEVKDGQWYFYQLFVNGQRRTRARTPNDGYLRTDGPIEPLKDRGKARRDKTTKIGFRYKAGEIKKWDNLEDINLFVYHSWTASLNWIASVDEEQRIVRFTAPTNWPIGYWERNQRYYVENFREALDVPGEWYLDRKTGILYYWPLQGEDMTKVTIVAPVVRKLVHFAGDPENGKFVKHIALRGLSFQHADWWVENKGRADGQAAAFQTDATVFLRGARRCTLENCEIAHAGMYGLWLERGCQDNRVVQCHIHDLGSGGVRIGETRSPKNDKEAALRNVIDNCFIHDGGHVFRAGVGVLIGRSSYNTISHNEIADFDYTGVSVGWSWGYAASSANHNVIEFNQVHHIGNGVLSDMGGIYTLGVSPGTRIANNIFHDIYSYGYGGWGLYTDEGSSDIVMENNIVYNTKTGGFHQHYGKENILRNNILAFSRQGQLQRTRQEKHISFTFERNIVYFNNGNLLSSNWSDGNYRMDYNLYWDTSDEEVIFQDMTLDEWQGEGRDKNSLVADPLFVDAERYDFRLKEGSPAFKLGFKPIDASKVGLYGPPDWVALPRKIVRKEMKFSPPPEPTPLLDDFEATPIGARARYAVTLGETEAARIRVTDEAAAAGKRSLRFVDAPGLDRSYNPHLCYLPNFRKGVAEASFDLRIEPGAKMYHEWRDNRSPYRVGPSIWIQPDGELTASRKPLLKIPHSKWFHIEIKCALGLQAAGTYDLTITLPNEEPKRFDKLPCGHAKFRSLMWFGFVSESTDKRIFYLDNLRLESRK